MTTAANLRDDLMTVYLQQSSSLRNFLNRPLSDFSGDPRQLVKHFNEVGERTPAEANTQMRVMRAIWNRAHKVMPAKVPAPPGIWDMNQIEARNAGFVTKEVGSLWRSIDGLALQQSRKAAFALLFLGLREGRASLKVAETMGADSPRTFVTGDDALEL